MIAARAIVSAERPLVFAFLADLENHWLLADRFVEVLSLEGPPGARNGGKVAVRGPLGIRRTATTRVVRSDAPESMEGTAEIGRRTRARVSWTLAQHPQGTRVRLEARVEEVGLLDRILLAMGGRRWLAHRFSKVIEAIPSLLPQSPEVSSPGSWAGSGSR